MTDSIILSRRYPLPEQTGHEAYLGCNIVVMFVGKDTGIPAFARGDGDNMTEERIAHILSEASQMMKTQVEDSHSNDSKSPHQGQVRYATCLADRHSSRTDYGNAYYTGQLKTKVTLSHVYNEVTNEPTITRYTTIVRKTLKVCL
jgi:hypothetical protein